MTKNVHMQFQSSINQQQMNQIGNQDRQISVLCTHNSIEIYNVLRHLIEYIIVEGMLLILKLDSGFCGHTSLFCV